MLVFEQQRVNYVNYVGVVVKHCHKSGLRNGSGVGTTGSFANTVSQSRALPCSIWSQLSPRSNY